MKRKKFFLLIMFLSALFVWTPNVFAFDFSFSNDGNKTIEQNSQANSLLTLSSNDNIGLQFKLSVLSIKNSANVDVKGLSNGIDFNFYNNNDTLSLIKQANNTYSNQTNLYLTAKYDTPAGNYTVLVNSKILVSNEIFTCKSYINMNSPAPGSWDNRDFFICQQGENFVEVGTSFDYLYNYVHDDGIYLTEEFIRTDDGGEEELKEFWNNQATIIPSRVCGSSGYSWITDPPSQSDRYGIKRFQCGTTESITEKNTSFNLNVVNAVSLNPILSVTPVLCGNGTLSLSWNKPSDSVIRYDVYVNNVLNTTINDKNTTNFLYTGTPGSFYEFKIKAVYPSSTGVKDSNSFFARAPNNCSCFPERSSIYKNEPFNFQASNSNIGGTGIWQYTWSGTSISSLSSSLKIGNPFNHPGYTTIGEKGDVSVTITSSNQSPKNLVCAVSIVDLPTPNLNANTTPCPSTATSADSGKINVSITPVVGADRYDVVYVREEDGVSLNVAGAVLVNGVYVKKIPSSGPLSYTESFGQVNAGKYIIVKVKTVKIISGELQQEGEYINFRDNLKNIIFTKIFNLFNNYAFALIVTPSTLPPDEIYSSEATVRAKASDCSFSSVCPTIDLKVKGPTDLNWVTNTTINQGENVNLKWTTSDIQTGEKCLVEEGVAGFEGGDFISCDSNNSPYTDSTDSIYSSGNKVIKISYSPINPLCDYVLDSVDVTVINSGTTPFEIIANPVPARLKYVKGAQGDAFSRPITVTVSVVAGETFNSPVKIKKTDAGSNSIIIEAINPADADVQRISATLKKADGSNPDSSGNVTLNSGDYNTGAKLTLSTNSNNPAIPGKYRIKVTAISGNKTYIKEIDLEVIAVDPSFIEI